MPVNAGKEDATADSAAAEDARIVEAEVVVPAAVALDSDAIRKLVGAKNVMGTCSG